jgi:hypothetical protein
MALVQIRVKCEKVFRDCLEKCWGCKDAQVVEVKNLSGKPRKEVIEERLKQRANGNVRSDVRGYGNNPRVSRRDGR